MDAMQSQRFQISGLQENSEVQILGISLVVQWLRFQAPDAGGRVQSLNGELDPTCCKEDRRS